MQRDTENGAKGSEQATSDGASAQQGALMHCTKPAMANAFRVIYQMSRGIGVGFFFFWGWRRRMDREEVVVVFSKANETRRRYRCWCIRVCLYIQYIYVCKRTNKTV